MPDLEIDRAELKRIRRRVLAARDYYRNARIHGNANGYGVSGNTFRSFGGYKKRLGGRRPSEVFKTWAASEFLALCAEPALANRAKYMRWDAARLRRLDQAFEGLLESHRRHKLADLFTKWCACHPAIPHGVRRALVIHGNCPIDKKSLAKLGLLAPGTVLNANPSMGAITSEQAYSYVQSVISEACTYIGCTPLQFDAMAWHHNRRKKKRKARKKAKRRSRKQLRRKGKR